MRGDAALVGGFSFRMSGRLYPADGCTLPVPLGRGGGDGESHIAVPDQATGDSPIWPALSAGKGIASAAEEWNGDRAMRFLIQHGEGDLVEEFPAISSAKRAPATGSVVEGADHRRFTERPTGGALSVSAELAVTLSFPRKREPIYRHRDDWEVGSRFRGNRSEKKGLGHAEPARPQWGLQAVQLSLGL